MLRHFWVFFLLAGILPATDQVILKNGDIISGAIVKKDGGKLTMKTEFLGDVSMPWTAVKSIRSDELLTVELPGGDRVAGKVTTSGDTLEVVTSSGQRPAPLAAVGAIRNQVEQQAWERLQHPSLLGLWTGFVDTGLALARGTARADTLTTNVVATRVTTTDKISVTVNQIYGNARVNGVTSEVANAIRGNWAYNRNITPKLFLTTLNAYEHDQFQYLDLRFVAGGGLGWNAIKGERTTLAVSGGGDYERESFTKAPVRNSGEVNFGDDFVHKFSGVTSVTQNFRFFPNLSETGHYRFNFDLGALTALNRWLGWHVTATDNFLSNPVFGRQRNDLVISTGLRISFAR